MVLGANLIQMTEQAPKQNDEHDRRPVGRLFLPEVYEYAKNFAEQYADLLHKKGTSFITKAELNSDGTVARVSGLPQFETTLWLEFIHQSDEYTWRLRNGRQEYDLHMNDSECGVTKYELTEQGDVLRRIECNDPVSIKGLQEMIESIIDVTDIAGHADNLRLTRNIARAEYETLERSPGRSPRERKERTNLKMRIADACFFAGSIGHRNKTPLVR